MRAPVTHEPFPMHPFAVSADRLSVELEPNSIEPARAASPLADQKPGRFGHFVRMIWRGHRTILITVLLSMIAAAAFIHCSAQLYTASAQIMIQRVAGGGSPQSSEDRQRALGNEEELVVSTPVLASALAMPGVHDISPLRGRPDALKLLKQQIRVDPGKGDDLLNVSYDAADPREGTRLVAAIVDSYVRFRSGLHGSLTDGSATTVLIERKKSLEQLNQKRASLTQFGADHGLAQGNEQVDAAGEALHELGKRLAQARVEMVDAKAAYDIMEQDLANDPRMQQRLNQYKENDSSLAAGDEQSIAKQICTLQTQLAGYGTKFMANYEPVQLLHRRIDDLKLTRDAIIQQRWQAAQRTESDIQASYDQEERAAELSEANQQLFQEHKADVAEAEKQVALFDKQLKEIDSANKLITTMVTVIEPATASDRPTTPRSGLILLISTLAGAMLGLGIAAARDARMEPVSPGTLKMLGDGFPVLARLPAVSRRQLAMSSWRDRLVDSATEFADACRKVHGALEKVASFSGGRTVLVTSTSAHEGKSTLASLLALTLAQTGKRVLLVDANLHAPVQGQIFDIEETYGLGQLLEEEIESTFTSYVHPGTDPRMDVLLAGSTSICIDELLNSQRFTNLMASMAAEYDYVLLDSPSLSDGSDARIIASSCDATIVLASESNMNRKTLNKTRDSLASVGANVIGVVVNCGMAAIAPQPVLGRAPATKSATIEVTTIGTPSVLPPAVSKVAAPVQSVFAAQVRRATDSEPDLQEQRLDGARRHSAWTFALVLILLIGGWMAFSGTWSAAAIARGYSAGRTSIPAPVLSSREEPVAMLMAAGGLLVVILLAGLQVRPPRQEIVLIVLSTVLAICTFHGGVINTLQSAQQRSAAASSAAGAVLLFATLLLAWAIIRRVNPREPYEPAERDIVADTAMAIFAQVCAMSALMILLSHWQSKGESLAVIAFSSCLAAMLARWIAPLRDSLCFWISPLLVALFGYACAALAANGIHIGMLVALARPLPMDYASMGPIGAVLGFWIARSAGSIEWPSALRAE